MFKKGPSRSCHHVCPEGLQASTESARSARYSLQGCGVLMVVAKLGPVESEPRQTADVRYEETREHK